jgi:aspartyl aminopeptidase
MRLPSPLTKAVPRASPLRMGADAMPSRSRNLGPALLTAALSTFAPHRDIANRCAAYLDSSPDPFHATATTTKRLADAGFTCLNERDAWSSNIKPGGKYFYTRNKSCVVAFAVGGAYQAGNGFKVIGAHTDSPNLRIKPRSKRGDAGCRQLDIECYGGGLWHTWFDRDLSLSGRVMVRTADGGVEQRLVKIERPLLRVPTLCIHLQSAEEREAFKVNKEVRRSSWFG